MGVTGTPEPSGLRLRKYPHPQKVETRLTSVLDMTMKRGAEKQLAKDEDLDEEIEVWSQYQLAPILLIITQEVFSSGEGFKKADESILATRKYVFIIFSLLVGSDS